ncbi:hypothetical protein N482_20885 [Pseudoalteromonas luteoviolacea NCIMB 1942]|uniref:Uncharacterized protein n=1 Tax=Pseudoalteromonas luteoviolacea NCIMB 1942 TaxID=1365253 RepID=A0A166XSN5_9GAMM|nr:hypothetical protein N482_20885 [Pseudoalteromonas luteoviolacea NCIMB 1942]
MTEPQVYAEVGCCILQSGKAVVETSKKGAARFKIHRGMLGKVKVSLF